MNLEERFKEASQRCAELINGRTYSFLTLKPSDLPQIAGVYMVWNDKTKENLYVGKTKNIKQRLYTNHLMGNQANARLKYYFVKDKDLPEIVTMPEAKEYLKTNCCFKFIIEEDMRERGHLEGLISYIFDCKYVDEEH
jgi:hypothetical protein